MRRLFLLAALWASPSLAVPLSTIGSFCGTFPSQCQKGSQSLLAARGTGTDVYYVLEVDPTTGALPVNVTGGSFSISTASDGPTGSPVPVQASYGGLNNGGTLIGAIGDSSGRTIVAGAGTAGTPAGGVLTVQGVTSMTPLLVNGSGSTQPVSGTVTANQGTANATPWTMIGTGSAGSAATGVLTVQGITSMTPLLVNGSGSTQPVSGTVAVSNLPATVDTNSGAAGASTLRFVTATRSEAAATPLSVRVSDGTGFNSVSRPLNILTGDSAGFSTGDFITLAGAQSSKASIGSAQPVFAVIAGWDATNTTHKELAVDSTGRLVPGSPAGRSYADSVRYAYSSGAVGTVTWVQLIASTAALINCIELFDSSGQTLELGTGAPASETRVLIIPPGGLDACIPLRIAAGTRLAIRALSATTGTVGEIDITGLN